ncbi:low temperature requirement protein A [Paramicrobacterium fandaimingii]|uniref:low temperature requirement protein A n=1 Tax=Paramicrobacterium fandaimingii TaxID=2708079 RepID=UPI001F399BAC|nr:low temperature requirement protein A [Microbacterium fandaimingii]
MRTRFGLIRMNPRDPSQPNRVASPLELFFDLVFVVSVSLSSSHLHAAESDAHIVSGVGSYLMVLLAVWWAWMNFTWFATAFDTDDWFYRLLTIVQMSGALVLAAGTGSAMTEGDFTIMTLGYVVMRLPMVAQWLRAAASVPHLRQTALVYAVGITIMQVLWIARLWLPEQGGVVSFLVLMGGELTVPIIAERRRHTPWHPEHITERYSLFTLILIGESVLASANAVIDSVEHTAHLPSLIIVAVCGLILAAGMWWTYFAREHSDSITSFGSSLTFGYGHFVVFAAAGALSAGIEVAIDVDTNAADVAGVAAAATLTVPVSLFLLGTWALTLRHVLSRATNIVIVALAALIGLSALVPFSLPVAAACMVTLVIVLEASRNADRTTRIEQGTFSL